MSEKQFEVIQKIIKERRSVKAASMNGQVIPNEQIAQLLELADWAPTHGRTEPWHFFVYTGDTLKQFGQTHGDLYWDNTPEDKRLEATKEKQQQSIGNASHLLIATMKRGANVKIPQLEEVVAASIAVQNILLGATALGISSFWSTGGMTHHPALKEHLNLTQDDIILGLIYLGYTDEPAKEGKRNIPLTEKISWM
jgi:nitroreductase